jgi:hypothetical protein
MTLDPVKAAFLAVRRGGRRVTKRKRNRFTYVGGGRRAEGGNVDGAVVYLSTTNSSFLTSDKALW